MSTIDISLEDDGSEKVLSDEAKLKKFIISIFSNDSADIDTNFTGTVINEPTYGYSLERLQFAVGGRVITEDYIKMRMKNALNLSPNSEIRITSENDIVIERDLSIGVIKIYIYVNGKKIEIV